MPNFRQMLNLFVSRKLPQHHQDLNFFVDKMRKDEYFSFSRFGDGEWSAILLRDGENCDGHRYSQELSLALNKTIRDPKSYYYGVQYYALKNMGRDIISYLKKETCTIEWYVADIFHNANVEGKLNPFIKTLRSKKIVIIGPEYLKDITLFKYDDFISIPLVNCFDAYDQIFKDICDANVPREGVVYLFSASMASNALIHELYDQLGEKNWLLDVGALWDIYVGKRTRSVFNEDWEERIRINSAE